MKTLTLIATLLIVQAQAGNLFNFTFTRQLGEEWECIKANHGSENPVLIATNQPPIGTNTPSYGGHTYRIDTDNQVLTIDGNHSTPLVLQYPTVRINRHHGFAIDNSGLGWIISTDIDEDNLDFFWTINLNSTTVTYYDVVGPLGGTPFRPTGLAITQFP